MRKASLGTVFLTVFLDLLGFGLVVPFLPGVARAHGATNLVATLLGAAFSGMQFLFIPLWGRLSDRVGRRPAPLDTEALRLAGRTPGVALAVAIAFSVTFWFSGMEQTFRLFTEDAFGMGVATTGRIFGLVGLTTAVVQGGLIHRLTRRFGEVALVRAGAPILGIGLALIALSPSLGSAPLMVVGSCVLALGYGLVMPSLSSYTSRQAGPGVQGAVLGVLQAMSALARALGPAAGGVLYQLLGMRTPYRVCAAMMVAA